MWEVGVKRVLLVTDDPPLGNAIAAALENEGYEARRCRGPGRQGYVCPAGQGQRCELALSADVIVLDAEVESGRMPSTRSLLAYYREQGVPVVPLASAGSSRASAVLSRSAEVLDVVAAVQAVTRGRPPVGVRSSARLRSAGR